MQFVGEIAGLGTTTGVRLVIGSWRATPVGPFADVMIEQADGRRMLLAPTEEVAELISDLYTFDETVVGPVTVSWSGSWCTVLGPGLSLQLARGERTTLGSMLRALPRRISTAPRFLRLIDLPARLIMPAVRTTGFARDGRRMTYGATDVHRLERANGSWRHRGLGQLAAVDPPVRFGFGSTPRRPSIARVVTTVINDQTPTGLPPSNASAH